MKDGNAFVRKAEVRAGRVNRRSFLVISYRQEARALMVFLAPNSCESSRVPRSEKFMFWLSITEQSTLVIFFPLASHGTPYYWSHEANKDKKAGPRAEEEAWRCRRRKA